MALAAMEMAMVTGMVMDTDTGANMVGGIIWKKRWASDLYSKRCFRENKSMSGCKKIYTSVIMNVTEVKRSCAFKLILITSNL